MQMRVAGAQAQASAAAGDELAGMRSKALVVQVMRALKMPAPHADLSVHACSVKQLTGNPFVAF